jgi:peptidyl-prolyl cis-trans isomerase B (cyclophilin B)
MLPVKVLRKLPLLVLALVPACASTTPSGPNPVVEMDTSMGKVKIELFQDKAPLTVKNFLGYVDAKHYDGTTFHRIIPTFMIQGGGFEPGMRPKNTGPAIRNESNNDLANKRGTLAMARTSAPDSATDQFFINVVDNSFLDRANARDKVGYCVFGKVLEGMDVVDAIKGVQRGAQDIPVNDVVIKSIRRVEPEEKQEKK